PNFALLEQKSLYPGIDLRYTGVDNQFGWELAVGAGGDAKAVEMSYKGARGLEVSQSGELLIRTKSSLIRASKPKGVDGSGAAVEVSYLVKGDKSVGFEIGDYDVSKGLTISASIESEEGSEGEGTSIVVDSAGSAYVTGQSKSLRADQDLFVMKMNAK